MNKLMIVLAGAVILVTGACSSSSKKSGSTTPAKDRTKATAVKEDSTKHVGPSTRQFGDLCKGYNCPGYVR